jgi:hypothetical protein
MLPARKTEGDVIGAIFGARIVIHFAFNPDMMIKACGDLFRLFISRKGKYEKME